jgi:hypothetical protein
MLQSTKELNKNGLVGVSLKCGCGSVGLGFSQMKAEGTRNKGAERPIRRRFIFVEGMKKLSGLNYKYKNKVGLTAELA